MLDVPDRAASCLMGFAKIPAHGNLLLRIPLAEYNAEVLEPAGGPRPTGERGSASASTRSWQSLMRSRDAG
jgi:hypothetical protein